jgi:hypothetical protein
VSTLHLRWTIQPLAIFAITRIVVFFAGYLAAVALPSTTGDGLYHLIPGNLFLDVWARWDSAYYLTIARDGYAYTEGQLRDVAFFPVYPLLTRVLGSLTSNAVLGGMLVSHLSFAAALLVLDRLTRLEFGDSGTAERTVFYLAAFPSSLFFSAVYSESTFLLLAVGTLYCARRQWWPAAGVLGALASATRVVGVVFWPVLIVEWLRANGWTWAGLRNSTTRARLLTCALRDWPALLAVSVTPLGLVSYALFLGSTFGDPIAFWTAQSLWARENRGPLAAVMNAIDAMKWGDVWTGAHLYWIAPLDLAAVIMGLTIGVAVFARLGAGYGLFTLLGVLIPLWSATDSMLRYVVVLFPLFMMLGHWGRRRIVDHTLSVVFLVLLGFSIAAFVNWAFIG